MAGWWKKKNKSDPGGARSGGQQSGSPLDLIRYLASMISEGHKTPAIGEKVHEFGRMTNSLREQAMTSTYLYFEQYLTEVDRGNSLTKSDLRRVIKGRFPNLAADENFALLFEPEPVQKRLLGQKLLIGILNQSVNLLGATGSNQLVSIRNWVSDIPNVDQKPAPYNLLQNGFPKDEEEWAEKLQFLSLQVYQSLQSKLGIKSADRIFEKNYLKLADSYKSLITFPAIIALLPDNLIDEEKVRILSHGQLQQVLFGKVNHLAEVNQRIQEQNRELKEARQELIQAQADTQYTAKLLSTVLDTVGEGIITTDETGEIMMLNQEVTRIWGYTREELIGRKLLTLLNESDQAVFEEGFEQFGKSGQAAFLGSRLELEGVKKSGENFFLEITTAETSVGNRQFFTAAVRDITIRKEEEERKTALLRKLKHANEELKEYAHIVSHDLKAPLRGISTLAGWIAADYQDALDEEGREKLHQLTDRVKRMYVMIESILEYSRIGAQQEEREEVHIKPVVEQVIEVLAPEGGVDIRIVDDLPVIWANEIRMVQVFQNLIGNAIKYNDKARPEIEVSAEREGNGWTFTVKDNGPGIEERYFEKVFRIFQTVQEKQDAKGTGIGLTVVKKIIENYQGKIWIKNNPVSGASFIFTLPDGGEPSEKEEIDLSEKMVD